MKTFRQNQSGFSLVEALLVLIFVALVAFIGVYVMNNRESNSNESAATKTTTTDKTPAKTKPASDPTESWTAYASGAGKFSMKYPSTWVTASNPELCSEGILLLGANKDSVGKCASDSFGQMTITWRNDREVCGDLGSDMWTQTAKETVTVDGVSSTKITATAKATEGLGSLPEGTKTTQYCFVNNGVTYIANYYQAVEYPDVLSDFNTMVTKTFKFE